MNARGDMSPPRAALATVTAILPQVVLKTGLVGVPTLAAIHGLTEPAWVELNGSILLGRDPSCDVITVDQAASRFHARLRRTIDSVEVTDLESRNGTFVDGSRVEHLVLRSAAVLRVGDTVMRVANFVERYREVRASGPLVGGVSLEPIRRQIGLVGPTDIPVLVGGETGTGKEIVARLLHEASGRSGPFVAVNCAALPETLIESELFGHVRGAYSGAAQKRVGLFAAAAGGTLFLDEVGELPLVVQAKLLRVLEDGSVRPVGGDVSRPFDVRVVSATNRDLRDAISRNRFRPDLFARLAGIELRLPPLRERPEDLSALVRYLLDRSGHQEIRLSADAAEALALHSFPMNVRELDALLRQACLQADQLITARDLPERLWQSRLRELRQARPEPVAERDQSSLSPATVAAASRMPAPSVAALGAAGDASELRLRQALRAHRGNVRRASQALGLSRGHVYRLISKHAIELDRFRDPP